MIEDNWLSNAVFTTVKSGVDLTKTKIAKGDFQTGSLAKAVNNPEANAIIVRAWLEKAQHRTSTLVFCVDIAHVTALTNMFRSHGVDAQFVTGDTNVDVRKGRVEAFRQGAFPVLLNCGIFTEGTDIPNIDCVLLARPTRSTNLLVQMIGRGLRKHPGKDNCHIIDMVSALETGIVTTPTLFGLDPDELVEETDSKGLKERKDKRERERLQQASLRTTEIPSLTGNIIFTDYASVNDLLEDAAGDRHIRARSQFAWVQIDTDRYILSSTQGDITISKVKAGYEVIFKQKLEETEKSKSPFMRPRVAAKASTFDAAVKAADRLAQEKFVRQLVSKTANWRSVPASDSQIQYLNKFRGEDEKLEPGSVTKGRAADWITKMRHGARGNFKKIEIDKRKTARVMERRNRFQNAQSRSRVSVGPLDAK
jgi:ATP-dependent helicase IRC3